MFTILEDISNKFNGQIPNLIYFSIGIGIGVILFFITFLIVYIISKTKPKNEDSSKEVEINEEYKVIIQSSKDVFNNIYKDAKLGDKFNGIFKITLSMLEEIAALYYPESEDPMFEVSIEQLVDFLSYFTKRLEVIIDDLLVDKLSIVESIGKFKIKDAKLAKVIEMLNKKKVEEEPEKKGFVSKVKDKLISSAKKIGLAIGGNAINHSFNSVIDDLGEDINKLYSNQKLIFTDVSKKELKRRKKEEKRAKKQLERNVGDNYA